LIQEISKGKNVFRDDFKKEVEHRTLLKSGSALSRCNRCSWIGPRASGGPALWCLAGCSFSPDTPCAR